MHYALLPCSPYQVPTVALELRLITELHRGRPDRWRPILAFLRQRGCDVDLVRRGISTLAPDEVLSEVMGSLET